MIGTAKIVTTTTIATSTHHPKATRPPVNWFLNAPHPRWGEKGSEEWWAHEIRAVQRWLRKHPSYHGDIDERLLPPV